MNGKQAKRLRKMNEVDNSTAVERMRYMGTPGPTRGTQYRIGAKPSKYTTTVRSVLLITGWWPKNPPDSPRKLYQEMKKRFKRTPHFVRNCAFILE